MIGRKEEPMLIMEYMDHGSLYDLLQNTTCELEGEQLLQMLRDVAQGVRFLHSTNPQILHGDLKARNILVDGGLRAKVTDFGFSEKKRLGAVGTPYWMAPELLRCETTNTTRSDVYAFGIILYEVYSRKTPYEGEEFAAVLGKVSDPIVKKRPPIPEGTPLVIERMMIKCWDNDAEERPTFRDLDIELKSLNAVKVQRMRLPTIQRGKKTTDGLLEEVFPVYVAEALRKGQKVEPETHDMVTIVFSDIVGFTTISASMTPMKVSDMLDRLYTKFDEISRKHDVFKVETIGDSWMGVTNLTKEQSDHVDRIVSFSVDIMRAAHQTWIDPENHSLGHVNLRVGMHSGPVVANVVGSRNPRYCLFGDTVNTASRMESHSESGRIQCSHATSLLLRDQNPSVTITPRGRITLKGKGTMEAFWVDADTLAESCPDVSATFVDDSRQPSGEAISERDDDTETPTVTSVEVNGMGIGTRELRMPHSRTVKFAGMPEQAPPAKEPV